MQGRGASLRSDGRAGADQPPKGTAATPGMSACYMQESRVNWERVVNCLFLDRHLVI